jgi:hypothetical protein
MPLGRGEQLDGTVIPARVHSPAPLRGPDSSDTGQVSANFSSLIAA